MNCRNTESAIVPVLVTSTAVLSTYRLLAWAEELKPGICPWDWNWRRKWKATAPLSVHPRGWSRSMPSPVSCVRTRTITDEPEQLKKTEDAFRREAEKETDGIIERCTPGSAVHGGADGRSPASRSRCPSLRYPRGHHLYQGRGGGCRRSSFASGPYRSPGSNSVK